MEKRIRVIALAGVLAALGLGIAYAVEKPTQTTVETTTQAPADNKSSPTLPEGQSASSDTDMIQVSEAFGHFIGRNLKSPGVKFDLESIIKGMRDGAAGKPAPMTDKEYELAMLKLQEKAYKQLADDNLAEANKFLTDNLKTNKIVELEPGKLQYVIIQEGTGPVVTEKSQPQITYKGTYADGNEFSSSEEAGGPITIPLDQTIPGFSKGLLGMKEGETRKIFVHPDLGYGTSGQLPPNKLLIFEVHVVKADNPGDKKSALMLEENDVLQSSISDDDADQNDDDNDLSDDADAAKKAPESDSNAKKPQAAK